LLLSPAGRPLHLSEYLHELEPHLEVLHLGLLLEQGSLTDSLGKRHEPFGYTPELAGMALRLSPIGNGMGQGG
jgi:hypothetical protein